MNYQLLKTELETSSYSSLDAEAAAAKLNEATIAYHVPVSSVDIATYLMETPCSAIAPLSLYNCLSLTYRNSAFPAQVQAIAENIIDLATGVDRPISLRKREAANVPGQYENAFGVLVQAGRYTQTEVDGVLDLGKRFHSTAQKLLGQNVTTDDVNRARNLDTLNSLAELRTWAGAGYNALIAKLEEGETNLTLPSKTELLAEFGEVA